MSWSNFFWAAVALSVITWNPAWVQAYLVIAVGYTLLALAVVVALLVPWWLYTKLAGLYFNGEPRR